MRFFLLLMCTLIVFGCGIPENKGDGFVSDFNKCEWSEASEGFYGGNTSTGSDQSLKETSGDTFLAQEFSLAGTKQLYGVSVHIKTTASVSSGLAFTAYIYADDATNDKPDSSNEMGFSESYTIRTADTSGSWINVQFDQVPHLSANTDYWLVLKGDYAANGTNYLTWSYTGAGSAFQKASSLTGSWTAISNAEAAFKFMPCR